MENVLEDTNFDVVILGTGLIEAILAGALARVGKKVLHLDANEYYGGSLATFNLESLQRAAPPSLKHKHCLADRQERVYTEVEGGLASFNVLQEGAQGAAAALLKNGKISTPNKDSQEIFDDKRGLRHYNLDLMPKLIWSVSPTIDTFIQAGVSRYLEFKALEHTFAFGEGTFHQVPCSKGDIFKSKFLSLKEKHSLMKFIQSIAKPEPADLAEIDGNPDLPFVKFLASKRLSEHLINYILYSIAMVSADQNNEESGAGLITTYQGMEAMARFLKSLGRYGNTPWIYPLYGTGEVVQAFARFAAVYGATYMLTTSAKSIVVDVETKKEFRGIVSTASNQIISAKYLISNPDHVPELIKPTSSRFTSRAVVITDTTLDQVTNDAILVAVASPGSIAANKHTIFLLQLDATLFACPKGKFVVHLWCEGSETSAAAIDEYIQTIFSCAEGDNKPKALWHCTFDQSVREADESLVPSGVIVTPDPDASVDPEYAFQIAKKYFLQMYPEEEWIPEVPAPEDIQWDGEDEEQGEVDAAGPAAPPGPAADEGVDEVPPGVTELREA